MCPSLIARFKIRSGKTVDLEKYDAGLTRCWLVTDIYFGDMSHQVLVVGVVIVNREEIAERGRLLRPKSQL